MIFEIDKDSEKFLIWALIPFHFEILCHILKMASNKETDVQMIPDSETVVSHVDNNKSRVTIWNHGCVECLMHYNDQNILQGCLRVHGSDAEAHTAVFKCNSCEAELTWSRHILKHMMVLSGERSYLCGVCAKPVSLEDMDGHTHEGTVLICGVCETECHTEEELEIHCTSHKVKDTKGSGNHRTGRKAERKKSSTKNLVRSTSMDNDLKNPLRIRMENELKHFYNRLRTQVHMKPSTVTSAGCQEVIEDEHMQIQNKRLKTEGLFACNDCGLQFKEEAVLKIHRLIHGVSLDQTTESLVPNGQVSKPLVYGGEGTETSAHGGQSGESSLQNEQCTILCGVCGQVFTSEEQVRAHCLMHTKELTKQSKAVNQKLTKGGKDIFDNQDLILANAEKVKNNTCPTEPAHAIDLSASGSGSGRKHLPSSIEQLKLLRSILENNGILTSPEKKQYVNVPDETAEAMDLSASSSGRYDKSQFVENSEQQSNEIIQVEVITGCSPEQTITEVETLGTHTTPKEGVAVTHENSLVECYIVEEESAPVGYIAAVSEASNQAKIEADLLETQAATDAIAVEENIVDNNLTQENFLHNETVSNTDESQYNCNVCLETFTSKEDLDLHSRLHDGHIPLIVKQEQDYCDTELIKDSLEQHLGEHVGKSCEICFKPLETIEHLIKHSVHNCCFCDTCFCNIGSLEKHMYMHHKRRIRYTCEKCGGKYNWLYHLQEHMLIHTSGEKNTP